MSYSIQEFENKYLEDFKQLRLLEEEKKNLEYLSKQTKEKILQEMRNVKSRCKINRQ